MPATAGRVRMPANNRVHSSAALQTHGIWQSAIGYDPYAPQKDESKDTTQSSNTEAGGENAYLSFQGLLQLARITNNTDNEVRGACKKCGRVGHLTFQCKNFVSLKDEIKDKDLDIEALGGLGKVRGGSRKGKGRMSTKGAVEGSEESSEDESESSDSSVDSEMERIIAERFGKKKKKSSGKVSTARKKKHESDDEDSDDGERKKRGRSKKRSSRKKSESDSDDEDDSRRNRRKEKRRKRDDSSEDEECRRRIRKSRKEKSRRRSHRHSDDSDESPRRHKRKNRRASPASDSDVSESDDSRVGRDAKRADKKSHKRHHEKN